MSCHQYDYNKDVCIQPEHNKWDLKDCGSNKWSLTKRACVDSSGNKVNDPYVTHGGYPINDFDKVGEFTTISPGVGRYIVSLEQDEMIEVSGGVKHW